jgi:transcriptional regulator with XRE-family HTH domain
VNENSLQTINVVSVVGFIPSGYTQLMRTVGENIARLRAARGLSQVQLADRLGVRQPSIWRLEHSAGLPNATMLLKVAKTLSCAIEDLMVEVDADYDAMRAGLHAIDSGDISTVESAVTQSLQTPAGPRHDTTQAPGEATASPDLSESEAQRESDLRVAAEIRALREEVRDLHAAVVSRSVTDTRAPEPKDVRVHKKIRRKRTSKPRRAS